MILTRERFKLALISLSLLVGGCASTTHVAPPSPSAAPMPKEYTCEQNRAAVADYVRLPVGSMLRTFLDDYRIERKALRAFHNIPEPKPCPQTLS